MRMESATILTPLYIGMSNLRLPVCIAIDLAHLSRYSQKGGGLGVNSQISDVRRTTAS